MKKKKRSYTVYLGGELFSLKHLIGNAWLAEAIYEKSHGRFRCLLPQDFFELRDDNGDCSEGWQLDSDQQIILCGATCERVQNDMQAHVELLFGCASGEVPIPR
jgi:hypothetical protein